MRSVREADSTRTDKRESDSYLFHVQPFLSCSDPCLQQGLVGKHSTPAAVPSPGEARSAPAQGAQAAGAMQSRDSGMPAGSNNSTGNMNTKGTGPGTTGTGGPGGSGNR